MLCQKRWKKYQEITAFESYFHRAILICENFSLMNSHKIKSKR